MDNSKDESYMYPHKVFRIRRDDVFNDAFVNFSSLCLFFYT